MTEEEYVQAMLASLRNDNYTEQFTTLFDNAFHEGYDPTALVRDAGDRLLIRVSIPENFNP